MKKLILILFLLAPSLQAAILKEDNAKVVVVWLFDSTTQAPETGVASGSVACRIIKDDGSTSTVLTVGSTNSWTEIGHGAYGLGLTSTNTNTAGNLEVGCSGTGFVSPPTIYDIYPISSYAIHIEGNNATIDDELETDCSTVSNPNSPAGRVCGEKFVTYDASGTADSGSTTTLVDTERIEPDTNHWANRAYVVFKSGVLAGQSAMITAFNSTTDTITFFPAVTTAVTTESYEIRSIPGPAILVWNWAVETGFTSEELIRLMSAAIVGKSSGFNTGTPAFRDVNDSKNRITSTTNPTGRTSVTYDKSP